MHVAMQIKPLCEHTHTHTHTDTHHKVPCERARQRERETEREGFRMNGMVMVERDRICQEPLGPIS